MLLVSRLQGPSFIKATTKSVPEGHATFSTIPGTSAAWPRGEAVGGGSAVDEEGPPLQGIPASSQGQGQGQGLCGSVGLVPREWEAQGQSSQARAGP